MAGQTRGPKKATQKEIKASNAPEVPKGPAPGSTPVDAQTQMAEAIAAAEARIQKQFEEQFAKMAAENAARILELEAQAKVAQSYVPVEKYNDKEGDVILIHFLEDGYTAQGRVWYRGQEVEVTVGDDVWKDSLDRNGNSWLSLTEHDQMESYGQVKFRRGPWPGKTSYLAGEWGKDAPPESELERADTLERKRRRSAPRMLEAADE